MYGRLTGDEAFLGSELHVSRVTKACSAGLVSPVSRVVLKIEHFLGRLGHLRPSPVSLEVPRGPPWKLERALPDGSGSGLIGLDFWVTRLSGHVSTMFYICPCR